MSGVFRTGNFGQSWETLPFTKLQGGVDSHVRFTSDASGNHVHGDSAAITPDGLKIVFEASSDDDAKLHLYVMTNNGSSWDGPVLITGDSKHLYPGRPNISANGLRVVVDVSSRPGDPYAQHGSSIASVNIDGTGFKVEVRPGDYAGATTRTNLRHPAFAPDGGIVFEGDWDGEQIWKKTPAGELIKLFPAFSNDNSPCVLSDGRFVSLWLERSGGQGFHEIMVAMSDGSSYNMALTGVDVTDDTIGPGGP